MMKINDNSNYNNTENLSIRNRKLSLDTRFPRPHYTTLKYLEFKIILLLSKLHRM